MPRFIVPLGLLSTLLAALFSTLVSSGSAQEPATATPKLEKKTFSQGTLYTLVIPAGGNYKVILAASDKLASVESAIWKKLAGETPLFVINGGYFDPSNQLTTSFLTRNGQLVGDPHLNANLTSNAKLGPYLPKIYNRTEFRTYMCQENARIRTRYDIVAHDAAIPNGCVLQDALGAGPVLLPKVADAAEGFVDHDAKGKVTRDPIGVCAKNARSAVGITAGGDVIVMMGAQEPKSVGTGFNLSDMGALLKARGAVKAMNLDGGSSSGITYLGTPYYGKFNQDGTAVKRPVKSVVMVVPQH